MACNGCWLVVKWFFKKQHWMRKGRKIGGCLKAALNLTTECCSQVVQGCNLCLKNHALLHLTTMMVYLWLPSGVKHCIVKLWIWTQCSLVFWSQLLWLWPFPILFRVKKASRASIVVVRRRGWWLVFYFERPCTPLQILTDCYVSELRLRWRTRANAALFEATSHRFLVSSQGVTGFLGTRQRIPTHWKVQADVNTAAFSGRGARMVYSSGCWVVK